MTTKTTPAPPVESQFPILSRDEVGREIIPPDKQPYCQQCLEQVLGQRESVVEDVRCDAGVSEWEKIEDETLLRQRVAAEKQIDEGLELRRKAEEFAATGDPHSPSRPLSELVADGATVADLQESLRVAAGKVSDHKFQQTRIENEARGMISRGRQLLWYTASPRFDGVIQGYQANIRTLSRQIEEEKQRIDVDGHREQRLRGDLEELHRGQLPAVGYVFGTDPREALRQVSQELKVLMQIKREADKIHEANRKREAKIAELEVAIEAANELHYVPLFQKWSFDEK